MKGRKGKGVEMCGKKYLKLRYSQDPLHGQLWKSYVVLKEKQKSERIKGWKLRTGKAELRKKRLSLYHIELVKMSQSPKN